MAASRVTLATDKQTDRQTPSIIDKALYAGAQ